VRRSRPDVVEFRAGEVDEVVATMADLADGGGWLVLQPAFDAEDAPRRVPSAGLFSSKPMAIAPVCTWVPGERTRNGVEHVAIGIEHAGRQQVAHVVDVPEGWVVQQDNPRRGLVIAVPPAAPHADVLRWLLAAGAALTVVPLNGDWRALVYRR
jgi:hypothetical protein